jgi:CBS domain-containing protein
VRLTSNGEASSAAFVRCPEDGRWMPVAGCKKCPRCAEVGDSWVTCSSAPARGSDRPELASIEEVMAASVLCVEAEATAESAMYALDESDAPIAIVVEGDHAIGVCSRRDLARRSRALSVDGCMTPFLISMLDAAKVADAIEVVAERGVSHVPVLSEGRVVGVVTPQAVIRWLTRALEARARDEGREPEGEQ